MRYIAVTERICSYSNRVIGYRFNIADKPKLVTKTHGASYLECRKLYQKELGWVMGLDKLLSEENENE